ncbi:MAG: class I SAM-dependent methyltransferase, partial [Candidatus Heimdallarchaeota archaeon]
QLIEVERLKYQAKVLFQREKEIFSLLGLKGDEKLLEVGSGPGYVTQLLIDSYPKLNINCLELNDQLVEKAKQIVSVSKPAFLNESILNCSLQDNSFDVIYVRLVLMHIPDVNGALKEIYRLLKSGGLLIVTEAEDNFFVLTSDTEFPIQKILASMHHLQRLHGGDRRIGRKLPRLLKETNFKNVNIHCPIVHSAIDSPDIMKKAFTPDMMKGLLEANMITEHEFNSLVKAHKSFGDIEEDLAMMASLIISGRK